MSWTKTACWRSVSFWKLRRRPASGSSGRGSIEAGSGGTIARIGLMNRAMSTMSGPYSSYASASIFDQRRSSRTVRPWSLTRHR